MKKYFLAFLGILSFFILFSFSKFSFPMLALGNVSIQDNDTFSNDVLIDLDYYQSLDNENLTNWNPKISLSAGNEQWVDFGQNYPFNFEFNKTYHMKVFMQNSSNAACQVTNFGYRNIQDGELVFTYNGTKPSIRVGANTLSSSISNVSLNIVISYSTIDHYSLRNLFGFAIQSSSSANTNGLDYLTTINNQNYYYLPFSIASNGKVSFSHTFPNSSYVDFHYVVIQNSLNGVINNKLKLAYYYSNFSLGFKSVSFVDEIPSSPSLNWYGLVFQSDVPQVIIKQGKQSVYYSNFKDEIFNFISQDDFLDSPDFTYSQVLGFGSYTDGTSNGSRTISIESLVVTSFGTSGGIVIPDSSTNEYEQYKPVSGPFDITTMIYNAFVWIIFNVPLIGPLLNLLRSVGTLFGSIITLGNLFSGFGIIFSIFVICLILFVIKKLNGGDD